MARINPLRAARRLRFTAARWARWIAILRTPAAPARTPRISYGHVKVPLPDELAYGGMVKFQHLQRWFPNAIADFNVLYLGSSSPPPDFGALLWLAHRRGAPLVWNQNGVAYPGWAGEDWGEINAPMRKALAASSHVFYQSGFCKLGADRFLGEPAGSWEILHNAVDTRFFAPAHGDRPKRPLTLLLGGTQYQRYRYETALGTLSALVKAGEDVRLIVTGELSWGTERAHSESEGRELARRLGLADRIEHAGSYLQVDAPRLFARADLLLHTKYNDPCPTVVLEAMACGLPVAYSASGGVPELVGDTGIGVPAELDWEQDHPPDPDALAAAVVGIGQRLEELAAMARARVVQRFDIEPWVERHRAVFTELLG